MPSFETLLADYGLLAILVLTFFEGETVVIVAGFLAHEGYFNPYTLGITAFLGTFAGDQLWFYLGRRHAHLKIVQKATVTVLQAIYEQDFLPCSYGFRPGRGPHDALDAIPPALARYNLALAASGSELIYTYDEQAERSGSAAMPPRAEA